MKVPDIFLTENDRIHFEKYGTDRTDCSLSGKLLHPVYEKLLSCIPDNVAPNVLSLISLVCLLHGWYVCVLYYDTHPSLVTMGVAFLVACFFVLDQIDGIHAEITRNVSPLGEIFSRACEVIGSVFLTLTLCIIFGIRDTVTQWMLVESVLLLLLIIHVNALKYYGTKSFILMGTGEFLLIFIAIQLVYIYVTSFINANYFEPLFIMVDDLQNHLIPYLFPGVNSFATVIYISCLIAAYVKVFRLTKKSISRFVLLVALFYRALPGLGAAFYGFNISMESVVCDGLVLSVIISDVILSRIAQREAHQWLIVFSMIGLCDNFASIAILLFYHVSVLLDVTYHLRLPLFTVFKNVYCDGIYDMCHLGHMRALAAAASFGNRLFVGVTGDKDAMVYKRKPVMSENERYATVAACKFVHKVIPDAPTFGLTEEFLKEHNIHIVAHSEEYEKPDDKYYAVPRKLGMTRVTPRTGGISTSDLMARIERRALAEALNNPAAAAAKLNTPAPEPVPTPIPSTSSETASSTDAVLIPNPQNTLGMVAVKRRVRDDDEASVVSVVQQADSSVESALLG